MESFEPKSSSVHGDHLADPAYMIRACIHNAPEIDRGKHRGFKKALFIDFWYWHNPDSSKKSIAYSMRDGDHSCTISHIDENDKWSREYRNCTAVIAIGKSKKTGKNISFLTHQDPEFFLSDAPIGNGEVGKSKYFARKLRDALQKLIDESEDKSVDVVIMGGKSEGYSYIDYQASIAFLDDVITPITGSSPTIIAGPTLGAKVGDVDKAIYVHTSERRVYFYRHYHPCETLTHFAAERIGQVISDLYDSEEREVSTPLIEDSFLDRILQKFQYFTRG